MKEEIYNLDEAAQQIVAELVPSLGQKNGDGTYVSGIRDYFSRDELLRLVKAGASWQKEQILKDSVSATVTESYGSQKIDGEWKNVKQPTIQIWPSAEKFDYGDKVKVIVIKE